MGGGETYPSAETVHRLIDTARRAEAQGNKHQSAEAYREASEVLLTLGKSKAITEDERYCFEMQSSELLSKAIEMDNQQTGQVPMTANAIPEAKAVPMEEVTTENMEKEGAAAKCTSVQTGAVFVGATGGFFAGSIIGVPLLGSLSGGVFGGVAAARQDDYGERARKVGKVGANIIDGSYSLNEKYNIVGNIRVGAESLLYKAREFDERHNVVGKVANAASSVWDKAMKIEEEHNISGKAKDAIQATADKASSAFKNPEEDRK